MIAFLLIPQLNEYMLLVKRGEGRRGKNRREDKTRQD
jgi:hypothetical protein